MFLYKRWYERDVIIIIFLIFLFPIGIFLMLKYSGWNKTIKGIVLGSFTSVIIFVAFVAVTKYIPPAESQKKQVLSGSNTLDSPSKFESSVLTDNSADYQRLSFDELSNVENYYYLYTGTDKSEQKMKEISIELRAKFCKKPCNISIYDEERSYDVDMEFFKIKDPVEQEEWKKLNYVYVADHLLEWVPAGNVKNFMYYPYKDSYYNELKVSK